MVIGRNPQLDQRRRRALRDERRPPAVQKNVSRASDRPARRYTPAVAREKQLRVTDLIPTRRWTLIVWHLAIATIVVAHAAFASWEQQLRTSGWQLDLAALRLGNTHGIARWTSAIALLVAAGYACLILNFRRHKIDDYRGRYRIWYPIAFLLVFSATLVGSGLSVTARSLALQFLSTLGLPLDSTWVSVGIVTITAIGVMRLMIEVLPSRASVTSLLLTGICFLGAEWLRATPPSRVPSELIQWSHALLVLASAMLLLMTTANFARFVYLDTRPQSDRVSRSRSNKRSNGPHSAQPSKRRQFKLPRLRLGRLRVTKSPTIGTNIDAATEEKSSFTHEHARDESDPGNSTPPTESSRKFAPLGDSTTPPAIRQQDASSAATEANVDDRDRDDPDETDLDRAARRRLRKEKKKRRRAA